jgi:hypothetical protein
MPAVQKFKVQRFKVEDRHEAGVPVVPSQPEADQPLAELLHASFQSFQPFKRSGLSMSEARGGGHAGENRHPVLFLL